MELNGRTMSILQEIASSAGDISVKQICDMHDINRRTFYYDLEKANDLLEDNGIEKIRLDNGRCVISEERKKDIKALISNRDIGYFKSSKERRIIITFYIGLSKKRLNISNFIEMFDVSKNTIVADLQKIREGVRFRGIELTYDSRVGYKFTGKESEIRGFLINQFRRIKNSRTQEEIRDYMNSRLSEEHYPQDYWEGFRSCLLIYEELMGADILETDIESCVFMICVSFIRAYLGNIYRAGSKEKKVRYSTVYESVHVMMQRIEERMGLKAHASEVTYIVVRLAGMQNFRINEDKIESEAYEFTERFLTNIEEIGKIRFQKRDELIKQMTNHLMPMTYRIGYGMQIENPLTHNIKQTYAREYELAWKALEKTDYDLAMRITDDELSYLAVFIASGSATRNRRARSNKILIICAEGVATALMLQGQLEELLGDYFEYEITSIKRSGGYNFDDYLMVITTLEAEQLRDRAVRVNVLLTDENIKMIIDYVSRTGITSTFAPYDIIRIVETHVECDDVTLRDLTRDLIKYLNDHREEEL